jgi:hypothetical protein
MSSGQKTGLLALILCVAGVMPASAVPGWKVLKGHVPAAVRQLVPLGRLPGTNQLHLAIGVALRDPAGLSNFLADVYSPASPNYRHFLTPEEFAARFSATAADYAAVKNFALTNGFNITGEYGNRLLLDVTASVADAERAFHLKLNKFKHPTEARDFFAPDTEPTVDAALVVVDIQGLSDYYRPHPKSHRMDPNIVTPKTGSGSGGTYFGDDFRNAYVPGATLTGAGQQVGLFQLDGYYASDIAAYAQQAGGGRTNIQVQTVPVGSTNWSIGVNGGNIEVSLDIEMAMSMAPGLSKILVFEGPSSGWPNSVLNAMAASNTVKNLSSSWGWSGGPSTTTDAIFQNMAAQGQSFFNASGDSDAFTTGSGSANGVDNTSLATTPSSSPYITQVGGTTLTTGSGAAYASETAWNWGYDSNSKSYVGSSGGVSSYYSIPSWQTNISMTANLGSTTQRNIPDVALTADNVYVIYGGSGAGGSVGGTSCAAPLWAGFMALVNQQLVALTGIATNSVGFINPAVYGIGKGLNPNYGYAACFHDTTAGNNFWPSSPANYPAVAGYDLCTGWGTPNGQNLINALAPPSDTLVITPANGLNASGYFGGPFSPSSQNYVLTNTSAVALAWSLVNTSAWLNVSAATGTIPANGTNGVTISLNAGSLAVGTYTATVQFTNGNTHVVQGQQFSLQVLEPLAVTPAAGFTASGAVGGPFTVTAQNFTLSNLSSASLNWGIANTSVWLNVSPAGGSLGGGGQATVAASLNSAASNLVAGAYAATVFFTNQTSGTVQSRQFALTVSQSLVQNGGFETGDFTGWTLNGSGGNANFVAGSSSVSGMSSHSGSYYAVLGQSGSLAYLSQTLATQPGQLYLVSLWLNSSANPYSGHQTTPNEFSVSWNGASIYDKTNIGITGWINLQFVVVATGPATILQFGGRDDPYYLGLDDVSVVPGFAPVITTQPTNLTLHSGGTAVFNATATGSTNLVYQWRKNGTNISNGTGIAGATTTNLTLTAVTTNSSGNYSLFVTNIFGVATSSVANLTVVLPPAITSSSVTNRTIQCGGNTNAFTVTASGTAPLSYQWSLDGSPVLNATNTSYSITNLHLPNHTVSVAVTNLYGSLASNAVLTVQDTIPPVITLNGANPFYVELGGTFTDPGATATDLCAGAVSVIISGSVNTNAVGTNTLTYTAGDGSGNTNSATRTVIVRDTTPPTILWSFTNLVLAANSNCVAPMPNVTGTNYILATDLSPPLAITQSPTNNSILPLGTNVVVITVADAYTNKSYSTNTILVQDQTPPAITLSGGNLLTNELGAAFTDPGVTASDTCSGIALLTTNGTVNVNAVGTNTLTYTAVDGSGNTNTATRTVIVMDITPPTILWSFTNLVLVANSNCVAPMPDVTGTNFILATDSSEPLTISQSPTNNSILPLGTNTVVITVAGAYGDTAYSTNTIIVQDQTPPVILSQPQSQTNLIGSTAIFSVAATACTPLTFQWYSNNAALAFPTSPTLKLSDLTLASAGNYYVVASANGGSSTSAVATLTVNLIPPAISAVAVSPDGGFSMNLAGSPGYTYILEATTNLFPSNWLPIATNTLGTNGTLPFTDPSATNYQQQFYRLQLEQ